jgi:CRISPR type III-A-associated RAMP protein Csm4
MQQALLIRLRPNGPWRYGPGDGGLDRVDTLYRSDRLYSAITLAMRDLGFLQDWLGATVQASPSIALSSLFPFQGECLFAIPPATAWPPPPGLVNTPSPVFLSKIRWKAAQFVPLSLIDSLLTGQAILADQWIPDPESGCLLRRDRPSSSPFRVTARRNAAVDRLARNSFEVRSTACIEFETGSGLWAAVRFSDESAASEWSGRIQAAFRLLSDTGFGGHRTSGWGQSQAPEFRSGVWPSVLLPKLARTLSQRNGNAESNYANSQFWLLSLYSPADTDQVDWKAGDYKLAVRAGSDRKALRMIAEGSVILAPSEPVGAAVDIAEHAPPHPVYRSGLALALKLPSIESRSLQEPVEQPSSEEATEAEPCPPGTEVERLPSVDGGGSGDDF